MLLIRNGTLSPTPPLAPFPLPTLPHAAEHEFLAVVGILTNRYVHSHATAHVNSSLHGVQMVYASCEALGYPDPVVMLHCKERGRSQLEHTKLWLGVAPGLFPHATHNCKADVDTLVYPQALRRVLTSLPLKRSVRGQSCWVDPCFWGVHPSTHVLCMHNRRYWPCETLSHISCGGFYALSYDVAWAISHRAARSSLKALALRFNENEEERFASHLIQSTYGGDFHFASDTKHWKTYGEGSTTRRRGVAVLHGVKKKRHWSSLTGTPIS